MVIEAAPPRLSEAVLNRSPIRHSLAHNRQTTNGAAAEQSSCLYAKARRIQPQPNRSWLPSASMMPMYRAA